MMSFCVDLSSAAESEGLNWRVEHFAFSIPLPQIICKLVAAVFFPGLKFVVDIGYVKQIEYEV